jgi:hypothetical protein
MFGGEKNPSVKRYTWRGPNRKRSRLDFLFVSSDLETFVINSDIGVTEGFFPPPNINLVKFCH